MQRCEECGCERLSKAERRVTADPHGNPYPCPLPGVQCDACGRIYADKEALEKTTRKEGLARRSS
jgi:hypothetical protein